MKKCPETKLPRHHLAEITSLRVKRRAGQSRYVAGATDLGGYPYPHPPLVWAYNMYIPVDSCALTCRESVVVSVCSASAACNEDLGIPCCGYPTLEPSLSVGRDNSGEIYPNYLFLTHCTRCNGMRCKHCDSL
jgi:hypothetical protein